MSDVREKYSSMWMRYAVVGNHVKYEFWMKHSVESNLVMTISNHIYKPSTLV